MLGIPVASLGCTGEHLTCADCGTCYRVELLAVPTTEQMQVALQAAAMAAVHAMLRAGDARPAARQRAVKMITSAGLLEHDDALLVAALAGAQGPGSDLAGSGLAGSGLDRSAPQASSAARSGTVLGLRPALEALAIQLEVPAREWFLAKVVRVGLADGSLSAAQRAVAGTIARYLGMSQAQAQAVISLSEEAAQAG